MSKYLECSCRSLGPFSTVSTFDFFNLYCVLQLDKKFIYFTFSLFWRQADEIMWNEVPELVLRNIFCKLEASDLCAASLTCRLWNSVASEDIIWKQLIQRLWKISSMLSSLLLVMKIILNVGISKVKCYLIFVEEYGSSPLCDIFPFKIYNTIKWPFYRYKLW